MSTTNTTILSSYPGRLFEPGQIMMTPGAIDALLEAKDSPFQYLANHLSGNWGDVCEDDAKENDFSVKNGFRIMSVYHLKTGVKVWVITEADRSLTTMLLPSEY